MNSIELDRLGKTIGRELLESPAFRQLVKEVVLMVKIELEEVKTKDIVRTFFRACEGLDIKLGLKDGKLTATNQQNLNADLREVIRLYRPEIVARLTDNAMAAKAREKWLAHNKAIEQEDLERLRKQDEANERKEPNP